MTRKDILNNAEKCVCGDRDKSYGSPEDSFKTIAGLWETYIRGTMDTRGVFYISPEDVAAMMSLMKIARIAGGPFKADSWIDLAGYAACGGEIGTHNSKKNDIPIKPVEGSWRKQAIKLGHEINEIRKNEPSKRKQAIEIGRMARDIEKTLNNVGNSIAQTIEPAISAFNDQISDIFGRKFDPEPKEQTNDDILKDYFKSCPYNAVESYTKYLNDDANYNNFED